MLGKQGMIGLLILVALLFSACQPIVAQPEAQPADEDATAAVNATWDEYVASTLTNDVDRRLALWADDGVVLRPGRAPVEGKEAIHQKVEGGFSSETYEDMTIENVEVETSGDMAFARGRYTVQGADDATGEPFSVDGTYMSIFKRQADGTWKLYRDMTHSNIPPTPPADVDEVADAINAVWREYEASILAGDPDSWIQLWEDDGVQLPPGNPPVEGKEAIYERISNNLEASEYSEFVIVNEDVEVNGDLAFARGNYKLTVAPMSGGDAVDFAGKYMTIFHQQPDGSWKIYRDIFNSSTP